MLGSMCFWYRARASKFVEMSECDLSINDLLGVCRPGVTKSELQLHRILG